MAVTVTFGSINRPFDADAVIEVPITLDTAVKNLSTSDFEVTGVDDAVLELDTATSMKLIIQLPLNVEGMLIVNAVGDVVVVSSGMMDTLTAAPITVSYNTLVPAVIRSEQVPEPYRPGMICDFIFQFNTPVAFYDTTVFFPGEPDATVLDYFIWTGDNDIGMPTLYVYSGSGFPSLPLPETLPAEWTAWANGAAASDVYLMRYDQIDAIATGSPICEVKERTYFNPL